MEERITELIHFQEILFDTTTKCDDVRNAIEHALPIIGAKEIAKNLITFIQFRTKLISFYFPFLRCLPINEIKNELISSSSPFILIEGLNSSMLSPSDVENIQFEKRKFILPELSSFDKRMCETWMNERNAGLLELHEMKKDNFRLLKEQRKVCFGGSLASAIFSDDLPKVQKLTNRAKFSFDTMISYSDFILGYEHIPILCYALLNGAEKCFHYFLNKKANPLLEIQDFEGHPMGLNAIHFAVLSIIPNALNCVLSKIPELTDTMINSILRASCMFHVNSILNEYISKKEKLTDEVVTASKWNNAHAIQILLKHGADVNIPGKSTSLIVAIKNGNEEIIYMLLKAGANVDALDPFHYTALLWASRIGTPRIISLLVSNNASINFKTKDEKTALHLASDAGRLDLLEEILKIPGIDINGVDKYGKTPLWLATVRGHADTVSFLISRGADISKADSKGLKPISAIIATYLNKEHAESPSNIFNTIKVLIEAGGIPVDEGSEYNPVTLAAQANLIDVVKLFFDNGVPIDTMDKDKWTPLFFAIENENFEFVKFLVEHKANLNTYDIDEQTPLYIAAGTGNVELFEYLQSQGAMEKPVQQLLKVLGFTEIKS